jgi:hypothetical protein
VLVEVGALVAAGEAHEFEGPDVVLEQRPLRGVLGEGDLDGAGVPYVTRPVTSETTLVPESATTRSSTPVPTAGLSARTSGTACDCMFEPMRARLASSCSRKGISDVLIDTICFGETSMYWISLGSIRNGSPRRRASTRSVAKVPSGASGVFACAMA